MSNVQTIHPMDELKKRLESILDVIPSNSKIYYIDYPVHSNCGDLLIMKGTETFLKIIVFTSPIDTVFMILIIRLKYRGIKLLYFMVAGILAIYTKRIKIERKYCPALSQS